MAKYCENHGVIKSTTYKFCPHCGHPLLTPTVYLSKVNEALVKKNEQLELQYEQLQYSYRGLIVTAKQYVLYLRNIQILQKVIDNIDKDNGPTEVEAADILNSLDKEIRAGYAHWDGIEKPQSELSVILTDIDSLYERLNGYLDDMLSEGG